MSRSSLWAINSRLGGKVVAEYSNSWIFSPIVWDMLFEKYLPDKAAVVLGKRMGFLSSSWHDKTLWSQLNSKLNASNSLTDRVCWELSNEQVFRASDKTVVSNAVSMFLVDNKPYDEITAQDSVRERFLQLAKDILELRCYYFVHKNTSVDDSVERWFWRNGRTQSLRKFAEQSGESVPELVLINDKAIDFVPLQEWTKEV